MVKKVLKNEEQIGEFVSDIIEKDIKEKNNRGEKYYLGLATGSTPLPVYRELVKRYEEKKIDFFNVSTYNLDEYLGLDKTNDQNYNYYMHENFFNHVNLREDEINLLDGKAEDPKKECEKLDNKIFETGIDLQILGIGENGHIAFNEPDEKLALYTHIVDLKEDTIKVNSRFFESEEDVPTKALTMGMKCIFKAKKVVLIATGKKKARAVKHLLKGDFITTKNPASMMLLHNDFTLVLDEECYNEAYKILKEEDNAI